MTAASPRGGAARTHPPEPGAIRSFHPPEFASSTLDSGLELRMVSSSRLPVVSVRLILDAGESRLGIERAGFATLTANSLEGGTRRRSGAGLAEALEGLGAGFGASAGWDSTALSLSVMRDRLPEALPILAEIVREPAFPAGEIDRIRDQRLANIEQRRMDPTLLANDSAARFIFADGAVYGRPSGGVRESVARFDSEGAAAFVRGSYAPRGGGVIVAGDIDPPRVHDLVSAHLGDWEGEGGDPVVLEATPRFDEGRVLVIDRPDAVQSEIRIGQVGAARKSPDYFPLLVFNAILGGAFTSRLNLNLREENGFTYGVRSHFAFRRNPGPFTVSTAVESAVTADAVRESMTEVAELVEEGPTEEEVAAAKDYIAGVFPLRFETMSQVAGRISELFVYGLPDDYHATYRARVREVTPEEVAGAARRRIRPRAMTIVVVGDARRIRPPLEKLALGPVEVHGGS